MAKTVTKQAKPVSKSSKHVASKSSKSSKSSTRARTRHDDITIKRNKSVSRNERFAPVEQAIRKAKRALTVGELYEMIGGGADSTFPKPRSIKNTLHHFAGGVDAWPDSSDDVRFARVDGTQNWTLASPNRTARKPQAVSTKSTKRAS